MERRKIGLPKSFGVLLSELLRMERKGIKPNRIPIIIDLNVATYVEERLI